MRLMDLSGIRATQESGVFELTEDIDISKRNFKTIVKFEGILKGNGYTISNLDSAFINVLTGKIQDIQFIDCDITLSSSSKYNGIINTNRGELAGVTVEEENIKADGTDSVVGIGGLVGLNESGTIRSCEVTARFNIPKGFGVGLLCGVSKGDSEIIDCVTHGNIVGDRNVGGICGTFAGEITGCKSTCDISLGMIGGGLLGRAMDIDKFKSCHFTGDIYGNNRLGGLIGSCASDASICSCSMSGEILGEKSVGGLIGHKTGVISLKNCHFTGFLQSQCKNTSGLIYTERGELDCEIDKCSFNGVVSSPEFTPFAGFSEKDTVTISDSYISVLLQTPETLVKRPAETVTNRVYEEIIESATQSSETTVSSEEELRACSDFSNIKLTDDITLSNQEQVMGDFYGILDGNGYCITNITTPLFNTVHDESIIKDLSIKNSEIEYSRKIKFGFLCEINKGIIKDIVVDNCKILQEESRKIGLITGSNRNLITDTTVKNSEVDGSKKVGSICGESRDNIQNCHAISVTITGVLESGGLVGCARENTTISSCSVSDVIVEGSQKTGGVCGVNFRCAIKSTIVNESEISGAKNIGGLAGILVNSTISHCHVKNSKLEGIERIGGLFSTVESGGTISNCSCCVTIKGKTDIGGFGFKILDCLIEESYSSVDIYANSSCSGFVYNPIDNSSISNCFAIGSFNCRKDIHALCSTEPESIQQCYWNFSSKIIQDQTNSSKVNTTDITKLQTYILL